MSNRDTDDPIQALGDAMAFNSRDFADNKFEAWIYGIVLGWDGDNADESAMDSVAARVGWDDESVARLRRLRENWVRITALPEVRAITSVVAVEG